MTKERLDEIWKTAERHQRKAIKVLDGRSEYDGADAARDIADLCADLFEALQDLGPHCAPLPPVAGRESP